jgi:hypothetical protein
LIEKWGTILPQDGKYTISVFPAETGARPKTGSANAKTFFKSTRWKKMREELSTEAMVCAQLRDENACDENGLPVHRGNGFCFGRSIVRPTSADCADDELPTLALWQNVEEISESDLEASKKLLTGILDEFTIHAQGVQALMGRWEWQPYTLDSTPYEIACGVHGQCTLMRSWLTKYLRGVTDDWLWIGRSVLDHLDQAAIGKMAVTVSVADGIRLKPRTGISLNELEQVLAAVLPSGADWMAGLNRFYGR